MARRVSLVDLSSRRRRLRRMMFWGGILLVAGLLAVGILWVLIQSGIFTIKSVEISGTTYASPESVQEFLRLHAAQGRVSKFLGSENILAWPSKFSEDDLRDLPAVFSLDIHKNYINRTVSVTVTERERAGIWCFAKNETRRCFWFDAAGTLFLPSYSAEGNLTLLINDYSRSPLVLGEKVLEPRFLPNLLSIFSALRSIHLSIREVRLNDIEREEVEAHTYEGPRLLFSLRFPVSGASDAIAAVEKITSLSKLQYVDFRVENKVYYK